MYEKEKGITLIALIITIIVMLILVGVTVTVALNGRLFNKAKQATTKTQEAIEEEKNWQKEKLQVGEKWYNSMQDYLDGKELIIGNWKLSEEGDTVTDGKVTLNIGDYVDYTPKPAESTYPQEKLGEQYTGSTSNSSNLTTDTDLKWRVLGVDANGYLTLISDKTDTKNGDIYFSDAKGYNNGVYILNDICAKLYSNTDLGVTARSLNIEDVEGGFSKAGETARNNYKNGDSNIQYGKTFTYTDTSKLNYPVIYEQENGSGIGVTEEAKEEPDPESKIKKDGIGESDPFYKTEEELTKPEGKENKKAGDNEGERQTLTCTQTYYSLSNTPQTYFKNDKFYEMIFGTGSYYWLASRFVGCYSSYAYFGLHDVNNASLRGDSLFLSTGGRLTYIAYLRPAVSLGSNINVEEVTNNSETNPHIIRLNR